MKLLYYLCTLFSSFLLQAQTPLLTEVQPVEIDERLYQVYDKEYLESVRRDNPLLLKRWAFYLDHSFYVEVYPTEKGDPRYPKILLPDPGAINILWLEKEFGIHKDWEKRMVYAIEGTDKVLVYYSGREINQKWNEFLGRKQPSFERGVRIVQQ